MVKDSEGLWRYGGGMTRGKGVGRQTAQIAEETKRNIVEAALDVFSDVGYEGASLRDVAARAGTTHGLIRHHFGSKEGVWRAVVDAADAEYVASLMPILRGGEEEPEEAVVSTMAAIVRGIVLVSARHPEIVRLLVHEGAK